MMRTADLNTQCLTPRVEASDPTIGSHVTFTRQAFAHKCKTDPRRMPVNASKRLYSLLQGAAAMGAGARIRSAGPVVMKSEGLDRTGSGSQAPAVFICPMPGTQTHSCCAVPHMRLGPG